jgi:hypothetical protein
MSIKRRLNVIFDIDLIPVKSNKEHGLVQFTILSRISPLLMIALNQMAIHHPRSFMEVQKIERE